jgi:hypothetical protein
MHSVGLTNPPVHPLTAPQNGLESIRTLDPKGVENLSGLGEVD